MSLTVNLPFDLGTGIRVLPESDTEILYCVHPESIARYNESGHALHAHLISMYSPSIPLPNMSEVVLVSCNESHCHPEIDFRDGYKDR